MNVKYDYERIVQGILDIGEAMIRCGAENFRLQDSLYRICRSYIQRRSVTNDLLSFLYHR